MSASLVSASIEPAENGAFRKRLQPDEEILAAVQSGLSADGSFQGRSIILTNQRVAILPSSGDEAGMDTPLADIVTSRARGFVGGGQLEIARCHLPGIRIAYTASDAKEFSRFARAIEQAKTGEPIQEEPAERVRCEKCGRLLPERNGICPVCLRKWTILQRIFAYLGPHRKRLIILILAPLVISSAALLPPFITGLIVDRVLLAAGDLRARLARLAWFVLSLLLVRVVSWGAEWLHGRTVAAAGADVTAAIRAEIYRHVEMLSLRSFLKRDVGSLISRLSRDAGALQDFLIRGLPNTVVNAATFGGVVAFLFWLHWKLALCIALTFPAIVWWALFFWRRTTNFYHVWWQAGSQFSTHVNETLSGTRITKMFRQENAEIRRFQQENERLFRVSSTTGQQRASLLAATGLITTAGIAIVWLYGGLEVQRGHLTPGTLIAFYGYLLVVYGPLQWFGQLSNWMTQAFTAAQGIFEILDSPGESAEHADVKSLPKIQGRVTFRGVHFAYERSHPVLRGIDLDVRPGEFIGVVGRSGVGKTTLMHLLCRFYDPDQGSIEIDGIEVRDVRVRDLRQKIGLVLQEPFLFSGTIAENISYGRPGAVLSEIIEAGRTAGAHDFIVQTPDGYDTHVGEGGKGLSQGEKQRIALARCLLANPRVFILDEATSSVDPLSERSIQRAVNRVRKGRTTFAIAHRLATLHDADRIVVLDEGRIIEQGTYAELVGRGGAFASLVRLQYQTPETVSIEG